LSDERDNVIHVVFGRDGTLKRRPDPEAPADEAEPRGRRDPLAALYSVSEVAKLFGFSEGRLRYWDRSDFLVPSVELGGRRYYTFQDLIGIRAAKGLIEQGVSMREVRRSVDALRSTLPKVVRPLAELRVVADGHTVVVQDEAGTFEPVTGQAVLDFRVDALKDDVVRVLRRAPSEGDRRTAYDFYLEGCRLDEEEATYDLAEEAYAQALRLDPGLANALTNLGNLCYRRDRADEAEALYRRALAIDGSQPEALYNLGFLHLERGEATEAVSYFERALASDPSFADAHFNLAMAYEELGRLAEARPHWETYLALDPGGAWSEVARRHLE